MCLDLIDIPSHSQALVKLSLPRVSPSRSLSLLSLAFSRTSRAKSQGGDKGVKLTSDELTGAVGGDSGQDECKRKAYAGTGRH